ncbi:transposase C of IS166 homeodomain protein [Paraburkholderia xenovorans LB400]|nr:transposase C of IS166 homeodomain protein [Paraburkholderia xenovorans LB400]
MNLPADLNALSAEQLCTLAAELIAQVQEGDREIEEKTREVEENGRELHYRQTRIEQLSHEIAILKRQQFGRRNEQLSSEQMNLLDEAIDADLAAIELELGQLQPQARRVCCALTHVLYAGPFPLRGKAVSPHRIVWGTWGDDVWRSMGSAQCSLT